MSSPSLTPFPPTSRQAKPGACSTLLGSTLNTKDTISAYLALAPSPVPGRTPPVSSLTTLLALEHGVNGFANMAHGGLICLLMDDAMSQLLAANKRADDGGNWRDMNTGELKTRFLKVVRTPQVVVVKTKIREVAGRKCWMESEVVDEGGEVLVKGEGVWIAPGGGLKAKV